MGTMLTSRPEVKRDASEPVRQSVDQDVVHVELHLHLFNRRAVPMHAAVARPRRCCAMLYISWLEEYSEQPEQQLNSE